MKTPVAERATQRGRASLPQHSDRRIHHTALFFAAYLLAVYIGYSISAGGVIAPIWPPAGIAVAGLYLFGRHLAPLVALGTVIGLSRQFEFGPGAMALVATVNTAEALLGATLLRRVNFSPALARTRDVVWFALAGAVVPPLLDVPAAIAVGMQLGYGSEMLLRGVFNWWAGNMLSILVIGGAMFVVASKRERISPSPSLRERVALSVGVVAIALATFLLGPIWGLREIACAVVLFLGVVWAALRHERMAVVGVNLGIAAIAVAALVNSWQRASDPIASLAASIGDASVVAGEHYALFANRILLLEGYVALVSLAGLLISAAMSERRAAERAHRRSENRFRTITEEIFDAFALFKPVLAADGSLRDLVFEEVNRRGRELLGIQAIDPTGSRFTHHFPTAVNGRFLALCASLIAERRVFEGEFDTTGLPGFEHRILRVLVVPLEHFLAVTARDVTDARRAEEQLRQALKMEAVGRLAGGVAHDFNNMMTAIGGYAELALNALPTGHPVREEIEQIRLASDRTASLTRQLLTLGRRQVLRREAIDPNDVVVDTMRLLRPLLGGGVTVSLDLAPGIGRILTDAGQLQQVVMNLALNARDAMPRGGNLQISTTNVDVASTDVHLAAGQHPGPHVELIVRDDGEGMDEATLAQAFDPFFTTRSASGGTGLGLSIVYGIAQQSGGHVSAVSAPGEGASFRLRFPRFDGSVTPDPADDSVIRSGEGECVLVVDDEDAIRRLIRRSLAASGYRVLEAANGAVALELVARHPGEVRLLVTDVMMPGMNGHEVARRARSWRPGLRVLFVSGYDEQSALRGAPDGPGSDFLEKPFSTRILIERVRALLDGPPAPDPEPPPPDSI